MWTDEYIGLGWDLTRNNCADFVLRVAREHDGLIIQEPQWDKTHPLAETQIDFAGQWAKFTRPIPRHEAKDGDLILLTVLDKDGMKWWHCGRYTVLDGREYLLHALRDARSHLTPLAKIAMAGMKMEGWARWKA